MKLRLLIVDDEPLARERARRLLNTIEDIEIIGEAAGGSEALRLIEEMQPDIVLLDIQMPDLNGLRVVEALDDPPAIIFSTAYDHHAVQAFELEAVDYLQKPYSAERLNKAIDRVRRQFASSATSASLPQRIPLENGRKVELTAPERILCAHTEDRVVFVQRDDNETLYFAGTLQELEVLLPAGSFFRASRHLIVNVAAIESWKGFESGGIEVSLRGGRQLQVSRRRAPMLKVLLK